MQLARLLSDITRCGDDASQRAQHIKLAEMLNDRFGPKAITVKAIEKWFARGRIPGPWLMKLTTLAQERRQSLNLADYV